MKKKLFALVSLLLCIIAVFLLSGLSKPSDVGLDVERVHFSQEGDSFELQYLVTLRGINSAELDGILPTMGGYQFEEDSLDVILEHNVPYHIGYQYHSDIPELRRNQFLITFQSTTPTLPDPADRSLRSVIRDGGVTELPVTLRNIGYWDQNGAYVPCFSCSYEDTVPLTG